MRFKLLLFTLLCSLAAIMPAKAETLTVYDGTVESYYAPAYIFYWDDFARSECVIPASVLGDMTGGTITAITFFTNQTSALTTKAAADFYLKEVSYTTISAYETKNNCTIVYSGKLTIGSDGQTTITLNQPFTYNGGNLLIGSENQSDDGYNPVKFYGQTVNGASIAGSNGSSASSAPATQQNFIPKTTFTYTPGVLPNPKPTDLAMSDITTNSAKASWTGNDDAQSYNLRYREIDKGFVTDFDDSSLGEWTTIDADGDGYCWVLGSASGGVYLAAGSSMAGYGYNSSQDLIVSGSYSNVVGVLNPDNYLVSPMVTLGGTISFWAKGNDANYPSEVFGVAVSTTGNTSASDFTMVGADKTATGDWVHYTFDLSAYSGKGYVAIRHYNCSDQFILDIDDISITGPMSDETWTVVNNLTTTNYDITGLNPSTEYEVQVQAVYADGSSNWTNSINFTTLPVDALPTNLTVTEITDRTATANWNGVQDSYNLRYRNLDFFENFDGGLPNGWTTIDNDGDSYTWSKQQFEPSCISSASFINNVGALTPDNWLITPKLMLNDLLVFDAWGQDVSDYSEVFKVYVSTTGTAVSDFVEISGDITTSHDKTAYSFDLSQYAGQEGYIAIRHYNCTNMYWLNVTNFGIGSNWVTIPNVTSPYTIDGLDPETEYEVQVQGVVDSETTTNWTESVLFTTLEMQAIEASLAFIETFGQGICGDLYTITDQLIAMDYNDGYNNDVYLWCKDQGVSVHATQPKDGQVDFMQQQGAQSGNWDQSNWVVLMISGENAHSIAESAKGHYLTGVTGIYVDDNNYMIEVIDNNFTISEETATYTPNVYCTANFINSNLTFDEESEGAHTDGDDATSYFFMNPKIEEYCTITWAQWDADKGYFVAPDNTGFDGAFNVSWDFNALGSIGGTLVHGELYSFNAIVQLAPIKNSTTPDQTYIVYPMDLSSDSQIPTAINTVNANGEVVGVEYVNSLGVVSKTPFQGVNIIVTRYSDGSTTTVKKVFR